MTAPAKFSSEGLIASALRDLNCSQRSFTQICKTMLVQISDGGLSESLNGKTRLDQTNAEKLLGVLERMRDLQEAVGIAPIDWSKTAQVELALVIRKAASVAAEFGDHDLKGLAEATARGERNGRETM